MHLRAVANLLALTLEDDPARLQDIRALAQVEREECVLLHQQDGDVLLVVESVQERDELLHDERRQAERELVDRERTRLSHQCSSDRNHLLLAARGASGRSIAEFVELRQERVDPARAARGPRRGV